nr:HepT-like ribonuclease domain-containing protein [Halioxenophilus sp. WMMB6]
MSKSWQPYALHILDAIDKIRRIEARGDLTTDEVLYDATLRNLQTLSEATQRLPDDKKQQFVEIPWQQSRAFEISSCPTTWAQLTL